MTFRDSESISIPLTSVVDPDGETEALKDGTTSHPELRLEPGKSGPGALPILLLFSSAGACYVSVPAPAPTPSPHCNSSWDVCL